MSFKEKVLFTAQLLFLSSASAFAGPGGLIAKAAIKNPFVLILLSLITLILSPIIVYRYLRKRVKINKTKKDLELIASYNKNFDLFFLNQRVRDVFGRVHSAWKKEDMSEASEWMSDWYWQNQQIVYIQQWQAEGLVNKCTVERIMKIDPLYVYLSDENNNNNSRIVFSIVAYMEDYLMNKKTGKIVQGDKGFDEVETYWTLVLANNKWVLSLIEEPSADYFKMPNKVFNISEPAFALTKTRLS
ncbi:Tim44 domain-containing protein [Emticicia sp. 17c]|uniref:Tim44 domain-containing protein n=1 Tax=Emticicia sp. 17c TaxID=3127704 RepID=UPI00301C5A91